MNFLVADKRQTSRMALTKILNDGNFNNIFYAESGEETIRYIENGSIDLAIIDYELPQINGINVIKYLRTKGNDTQMILLAPSADKTLVITGIKVGASGIIARPLKPKTILAKVNELLQKTKL